MHGQAETRGRFSFFWFGRFFWFVTHRRHRDVVSSATLCHRRRCVIDGFALAGEVSSWRGRGSTSSARGLRGALTFGGARGSEGARVTHKAIEGIVGAETPLDRATTEPNPSGPHVALHASLRVFLSARVNEKIDLETVKSWKSRALGEAGIRWVCARVRVR